jgi:peptidoglycan/LPS O-acetylase OafA/YrhL
MQTQPLKQSKNGNWINGLDTIRFILALIVFLSHLYDPYHDLLVRSPYLLVKIIGFAWDVSFNGVAAVMAFFIISGFVIHYPYRDHRPATASFLIRRWLRVGLPLLVISGIASCFHLFSEIPVWSLYCELIYYTIYPVLIRIGFSWKTKFGVAFLLSFVLIVLLAPNEMRSLVAQRDLHFGGLYWQLGPYLTWIVGLPCWLLGVMLAEEIPHLRTRVSNAGIWIMRATVALVGVALNVLKFHFFLSCLLSMNFFAILLYVWIKKEILFGRDKRPLSFLEYLGTFSYSLYLCHNVIVDLLSPVMPVNVYTYFPIICLTILFSWVFFQAVEKPSHALSRGVAQGVKNKWFRKKKILVNER